MTDKDNIEVNNLNSESCESINVLKNDIETLEKKVTDNWELYLRSKAEIENLKKLNEKEIEKISKYALKSLMLDLLPFVDGLELYIKNENISKNDGLYLTFKIFLNILEKYNLKKIIINDTTLFDPMKHEVVSITNDNSIHNNKIMSVLQDGYILNDQILRYSKVSINKN
jgi:molecular chaperone GrpE